MISGRYSIRDLEKLTGIKAHTLRMWEKRHKIMEPHRTDTNIRYYDDNDLKKILNISLLNNRGFKISKLAGLSIEELNNKVLELSEAKSDADLHIDRLVISMIELDEAKFEKVLSDIILRFGFETSILYIVYPFLEKIGVLWITGNINPAHEHFISNLLRQKLIVAVDSVSVDGEATKSSFLLYLPENEMHEMGLLFSNYLIRKNGFKTIYLGQNVPFEDLEVIMEVHEPEYIFTYFTGPVTNGDLQNYLDKLSESFPKVTIYVTGHQVRSQPLKFPPNITFVKDALSLKEQLKKLS